VDEQAAAALWAQAHALVAGSDPAAELAQLEAIVYSRRGSTEAVVDFVNPVTGQSMRVTPSQLRLQVLRARVAAQSAPHDDREAEAVSPPADVAQLTAPSESPAEALNHRGLRRRRFVVPSVAVAAFAIGVVTALILGAVLGTQPPPAAQDAGADSAALTIFEAPSQFASLPLPDLGDRFRTESIRNISGTSPDAQGFGVYLARTTSGGLYCMIAKTDAADILTMCSPADEVARHGLVVEAPVLIPSLAIASPGSTHTVLTFTLTASGTFNLGFPPAETRAVAPPTTQGTTLNQWQSLPGTAGFTGEVDAQGQGLIVAIACIGLGTVTVDVGGYVSVFNCRSGQVQGFTNYDYTAHGAESFRITPLGNVSWGLTLASIPLDRTVQP